MGIASYPLEEPQNMQNESAETVDVCDWLITMVGDVRVAVTMRPGDVSQEENGILALSLPNGVVYTFTVDNILYIRTTERQEIIGKPTIPQDAIDRFNGTRATMAKNGIQ